MGGKKGGKGSSKEERRAAKANANRSREHRREARRALDRSELAQFAVALKGSGLTLNEVGRDGNCFFRSLSDQLENNEHNHQEYRDKVIDFVEKNAPDFEPFFSFGEGDDEEDANFGEYVERMRRDGEWAGQPELLAAARALNVHIMVHQFKMPAYRIDAPKPDAQIIHVSYHDGDHYNSVRDPAAGRPVRQGARTAEDGSASTMVTSQDDVDTDGLEAQVGSMALRDAAPRSEETAKKKSKEERRAAKAAASRAREQGAYDVGTSAGGGDDGGGEDVAADEEGGEQAAEEAGDERGTLEARRQDKARRKEEKRLRKEARNREAVAGSETQKPQGDWTTAVISL